MFNTEVEKVIDKCYGLDVLETPEALIKVGRNKLIIN
jgi:hypothetical protein